MANSSDDALGAAIGAATSPLHGAWSSRHGGQRPASALRLAGATHGFELWLPHDARRDGGSPSAAGALQASTGDEAARPWERREIAGHDDALGCIEPLFSAGGDRDRLRQMVASFTDTDVWREDDDSLRSELARLLLSRRLWLMRRRPLAVRAAGASPQPMLQTSAMTPSMMRERPSAAPAAAPPAEIDPFQLLDQDAQALVLLRAALQGVPFCEECERLKKERALDRFELAQQEAQAAVLKAAAEEGLPFCEECERAKQAQQNKSHEQEEAMA